MKLTMTQTCPACPVQYEGTVEGKSFYFRARWTQWAFAIAGSLDEAIELADRDPSTVTDSKEMFVRTGMYDDGGESPYAAGCMPHEEAERLIRQCAQEYLERKPPLRT